MRDEIDFLIDGADAKRLRLLRRMGIDWFPFSQQSAAVAAINPGEDFDERALAGPVLAHEGVNLSAA